MIRHYVFGPVASRRLGVSLGVDLVPAKTCSLDCIYCEARQTTCLTLERKEYVPVDAVIRELDEVLSGKPELNFITFSGSGEPTLNSGIGRVVDFLKTRYPQYPVCLLTNGFALGDPEVRREIARIDRVVPSLDASNTEEFIRINRPAPGLEFGRFVKELTAYTQTASSEIYLELFIVPGVNDSDESIRRFVEIVRGMKLVMVQLNTLDRPGVVDWVLRCYDAESGEYFTIPFDEVPVYFPGTGDIFSSVLLGRVLKGYTLRDATKNAMDVVRELIVRNADQEDKPRGIPIEACLDVIDGE